MSLNLRFIVKLFPNSSASSSGDTLLEMSSDGSFEHIAVLDIPLSDFGDNPADLSAITFVNITGEKLPSQDFLNMLKTINLE